MSLVELDRALRQVPFIATMGVRVEEARPGHLVLRLPYDKRVTNHAGALHTAAIFACGELAAAVVLATHPELGQHAHLLKSTKIKYFLPSSKDVTAHATVTDEMVAAVIDGLKTGNASMELPIKVLDGHGNDVAELAAHFAFRKR